MKEEEIARRIRDAREKREAEEAKKDLKARAEARAELLEDQARTRLTPVRFIPGVTRRAPEEEPTRALNKAERRAIEKDAGTTGLVVKDPRATCQGCGSGWWPCLCDGGPL